MARCSLFLRCIVNLATHDFIHLVTGFDTSWPGDIGVLAATVEQAFAPRGAMQLRLARVVYFLRAFRHRAELRLNLRVGREIGAAAENLLAYRYEDNLEENLDVIRKELRIPEPAATGMAFSLVTSSSELAGAETEEPKRQATGGSRQGGTRVI